MKLVRKQIDAKWYDYVEKEENGEEVVRARFKIRPFPITRAVYRNVGNSSPWADDEEPAGLTLDALQTMREQFIFCVQDWDLIEDAEGNPIPCNKRNKEELFDYGVFPDTVLTFIIECINKPLDETRELEKN